MAFLLLRAKQPAAAAVSTATRGLWGLRSLHLSPLAFQGACPVAARGFCAVSSAAPKAEDEYSKEAVRKRRAERIASGIALTGPSAIRRLNPTSPGQRGTVLIDRSHLWKGGPVRGLSVGLRSSGGRGNKGRIAVRHRGGGHKRRYRFVDFKRAIVDEIGEVKRFEYDPNRSAHLALVHYPTINKLQYIIAPQDMKHGDLVEASRTRALEIKPGFAMPLRHIPIGTIVHMLEIQPGHGAQLARGAGTFAQIIEKDPENKRGFALVRLASKEVRYMLLDCMATVGVVSNPLHKLRKLGKAGRARWMGSRSSVRGVAMNPVDHPHGGREGKGRPGRPSVSYSGVLAKGFKTRKRKRNPLVVVRAGGDKKAQAAP